MKSSTKTVKKRQPVKRNVIKKSNRLNCWEIKKCGREKGGEKVNELGICPASGDKASDGLYGGKNAGRSCWSVAGTFCGGKVQGTFAQKRLSCMNCDVFKMVIEEEGFRISPKEIDLNECLDTSLGILRSKLIHKCLINKEYNELPLTNCYSKELTQAFVNIIVNAEQSISSTGNIQIKSWHKDGFNYISIADTGCGIPEDIIERIFEPFLTTKKGANVAGIGLRVAYDIIKKHNGDISVESEVGKGTTFTIKLPVCGGN